MPEAWPQLPVRFGRPVPVERPAPSGTVNAGEQSGEIWMEEGSRIELTREPLEVRFNTHASIPAAAILHPLLGLPAALAARWLGRFPLHGGAFAYRGRAWALLGSPGAGKSSTLAHLLQAGRPVLSDDILILEGTTLFSGPRSVDLRADAAGLGGVPLGQLGSRERWRVSAPACPPSLPLGGLIKLEWGARPAVHPLDPGRGLRALLAASVFAPRQGEEERLLELAALPTCSWRRPRGLHELPRAVEVLLDALPD